MKDLPVRGSRPEITPLAGESPAPTSAMPNPSAICAMADCVAAQTLSATFVVAAEQLVGCTGMPHTLPSRRRSEEHTSELQSLMRISYAVCRLQKKKTQKQMKTN